MVTYIYLFICVHFLFTVYTFASTVYDLYKHILHKKNIKHLQIDFCQPMQNLWIIPNLILNQVDSQTDEEDLPNTVLPTEISGLIMKNVNWWILIYIIKGFIMEYIV